MTKLAQHLEKQFADKKILILGLAREGLSTYHYLHHLFPNLVITLMDQAEHIEGLATNQLFQNTTLLLGPATYLKNLDRFDLIFKTPSLPIREAALQTFLENGGEVTTQSDQFLQVYRQQTVGVTGTKGKSTTSAVIAHILNTVKKQAILAGNIGIPLFDIDSELTPKTTVVVEMSSYQLETVHASPHWAIWINLFSEHLNYHGSFANYAAAKQKITQFQLPTDFLIYNQGFPVINEQIQSSSAIKIPFQQFHDLQEVESAVQAKIASSLSEVFLTADFPAILQLMKLFDIDLKMVISALTTFTNLPHRLETITSRRGPIFIDDTLATIPEATVAAIHAFPHIQIIILGGYDRGIEYDLVVREVVKAKVPVIIFFRPSGEKMNQILEKNFTFAKRPRVFFATDMQSAVKLSYENASTNQVVLLSPASPSYGQFKDYQDKSAQFRDWIAKLDNPPNQQS